MIAYFTNRELSNKLKINLAKWKRWSREFLPPDPLGGMQSGYARQYHPNDAFTVFLGGHLVSVLRYNIPETRKILSDLKQWLLDKRFYLDLEEKAAPIKKIDALVREYRIFIHKDLFETAPDYIFSYTIRGIISDEAAENSGCSTRKEEYIETRIPDIQKNAARLSLDDTKILNITILHHFFSELSVNNR